MIASLHPLRILGLGLGLAVVVSAGRMIRYVPHRQEQAFGVAALTLVALLNVASWLTGFSVGWALSILNGILGLSLTMLTTHYRPHILFATLTSLLLALFMRGHFLPARQILLVFLAIVTVGAGVRVVYNRQHRREPAFSFAGMAMVACLGGLALLTSPPIATWLTLLTVGVSVLMGILSYQWQFLLVSGAGLLWAANLLL